ncbi:MAG: ribosome small subunit-dependent GTPase A [Parachlamydiaceae bacterium]|nr:ribosome small subunit-dependent GTPase A [Parachlamydiaceae bacterium]
MENDNKDNTNHSDKIDKNDDRKYASQRWEGCPLEEHYFGTNRKADKLQKKIFSAKDRSKYKKTDRDQQIKIIAQSTNSKLNRESLHSGRVISIVPKGILVESEGKFFSCLLRGVLKKERTRHKNLVIVGDIVLFDITGPSEGYIAHIEPRKTTLSRADNLSRRKEQLIAANIDQVIITASVVSPMLKPPLLDRYIISARKGGLEPVIVINKIDLLENPDVEEHIRNGEKELYIHLLEVYKQNNIPTIALSVSTGQGLEELSQIMRDKASVFSGQSGVGKSSLINAVTGSSLRIGDMVESTKKGSHTTTTTNLLPLEFGGWCIDTPGIKSFGIWELKKEEIESYFTEIHTCGKQCHFPNCSHTHEANCAVIQAVENKEISIIRYYSYISLVESVGQKHVKR